MYQRILVPVDGSESSKQGLVEAIALAKLTGGQILLVHVIDEPFVALGIDGAACSGADLFQIVREAGQFILTQATETVARAGIRTESKLLDSFEDRVCDLVVKAAQDWRAELIVIGTHGRRGIGRLLLGSDAEQILRLAPAPVLLVRGAELPG